MNWNPNYRTDKGRLPTGFTVDDFAAGDRVFHWFSGAGTVTEIDNQSTLSVRYDDNSTGGGYAHHYWPLDEYREAYKNDQQERSSPRRRAC